MLGISSEPMNGSSDASHMDQEALSDWKQLKPHRDEDQVQLDVNRSFIYYPNGKSAMCCRRLMKMQQPPI